jgi:hypothetical protein
MKNKEINTEEFVKTLNKQQPYFAQSINGTGETRSSKSGKVNFNVVLSGNNLNINREGVYNSNRFEIYNSKINSIEELESIVTEKCGLKNL